MEKYKLFLVKMTHIMPVAATTKDAAIQVVEDLMSENHKLYDEMSMSDDAVYKAKETHSCPENWAGYGLYNEHDLDDVQAQDVLEGDFTPNQQKVKRKRKIQSLLRDMINEEEFSLEEVQNAACSLRVKPGLRLEIVDEGED